VEKLIRDSLWDCVKRNYYSFYNMMSSYIPDSIEIVSAGIVHNKYSLLEDNDELFKTKKRNFPLFQIMLKINETEDDFTFTLSPKDFKQLFLSYFQKTLKDMDNIPDLESRFLPRYENFQIVKGKIKVPILPQERPASLEIRAGVVVDDDNLWLWELFQKMKQDMDKVTEPLFVYQGKYSQYKDFLTMKI
jgi:hypothetical protein